MTFLEICQMVLREADQEPFLLTDVRNRPEKHEQQLKVIGWVQNAYQRLQRKHPHWKFHHNSGVFITTLDDGTKDYTVASVREVLRDSIKANVSGQTAQWGLTYLTYKEWRDLFNVYSIGSGVPQFFVELPDGDFRIEPAPNSVCEVSCDWYATNSVLLQNNDVPIWDTDFHAILAWMALQDYMDEYEAPELLGNRVRRELGDFMLQFNNKYLPEMEIAGRFF